MNPQWRWVKARGTRPDDAQWQPLVPTCGVCTALLDVRWAESGDCIMRCAPCGREYVFPARNEREDLRTWGASLRDPHEIWAFARLDEFSGDDTAEKPASVRWPLLWVCCIAFAITTLFVARALWR